MPQGIVFRVDPIERQEEIALKGYPGPLTLVTPSKREARVYVEGWFGDDSILYQIDISRLPLSISRVDENVMVDEDKNTIDVRVLHLKGSIPPARVKAIEVIEYDSERDDFVSRRI